MDEKQTAWSLYLVRTASGMLYTGITNHIERRFAQHQAGTGAKALRGKGPLSLVFYCEIGDRSVASQWEYRIKQLTKKQKETLVAKQPLSLSSYFPDIQITSNIS